MLKPSAEELIALVSQGNTPKAATETLIIAVLAKISTAFGTVPKLGDFGMPSFSVA
jgi:hypothetical protein